MRTREVTGPTGGPAGLLLALLELTSGWAAGADVDLAAADRLRLELLELNHERYVDAVPAYRALAADAGIAGRAPLEAVVASTILDEGFFKSYDPRLLGEDGGGDADLAALTGWLDGVGTTRTGPVAAQLEGVRGSLAEWREVLKREAGLAVTFSSGTTGRPSLVPRSRATVTLLRTSGGVRLPWADLPAPHDALLLTGPGLGSGLQSGAAGLAGRARRVRFAAGRADVPDALGFLRDTARDGVPALVYGPPALLVTLLEAAAAEGPGHGTGAGTSAGGAGAPLPLPAGSVVVTGGGWKRSAGRPTRDPADVVALAAATLAVPPERVVDTYSTAELNTVLARCRDGRYHVPPVLGVVVLDALMQPVPLPARGRLAFLDPLALSYPGFLATGDEGLVRDDPCPCGLRGPAVDGPVTRSQAAPQRGCGVAADAS